MSDKSKEPSELAKNAAKNFGLDHFGDWPGDDVAAIMFQTLIDTATAELQCEVAELKQQLHYNAADWADDDTRCKALARPFIGDFDNAEHPGDRQGGFRGVIEVTEALVAQLQQKDQRISELSAMLEEAIRVFDRYLNVPESVALKARWAKFKVDDLKAQE